MPGLLAGPATGSTGPQSGVRLTSSRTVRNSVRIILTASSTVLDVERDALVWKSGLLARLTLSVASLLSDPMASPRIYLDYNAHRRRFGPRRCDGVRWPPRRPAAMPPRSMPRARRARLVETARPAGRRPRRARGPNSVIFTSGGTEAANLALAPLRSCGRGKRVRATLIVGASEHAAVLQGHRFRAPTGSTVSGATGRRARSRRARRPARRRPGPCDRGAAGRQQRDRRGPAGREVAALVHAAGGVLVCDAVQAAGRIACDRGGARGRRGAALRPQARRPAGRGRRWSCCATICRLEPLLRGGGQERGLRAGTENVPGHRGLRGRRGEAAASEAAQRARRQLRDRFEAALRRHRARCGDLRRRARRGCRTPAPSASRASRRSG